MNEDVLKQAEKVKSVADLAKLLADNFMCDIHYVHNTFGQDYITVFDTDLIPEGRMWRIDAIQNNDSGIFEYTMDPRKVIMDGYITADTLVQKLWDFEMIHPL